MGIKYHFEVKDQKQAQRFQTQQAKAASSAPQPGMRATRKATKKQRARLAAKAAASDQ